MPIRFALKPVIFGTASLCLMLAVLANAAPPAEILPATRPEKQRPRIVRPEEKSLAAVGVGIQPKAGKLPENSAENWLDNSTHEQPHYPGGGLVYFWDAPDLYYRPLYFEQVNAERHGYSRCPLLQPVLGGAHFFASTVALPYQMTVHRPRECVAPLGHYRAGSPVPYQRHWPEPNAKAAIVQTAVIGGLIFIIP